MMSSTPIFLDHIDQIIIYPNNSPIENCHALKYSFDGLYSLYRTVRHLEIEYIKNDPHASSTVFYAFTNFPSIIPCSFNWFSITIVNYLRLVALTDFLNRENLKSDALMNASYRKKVKTHCADYVKRVLPEIYLWRNKIAAHHAATDPVSDDSLATLEQSIMNNVTYSYPYYRVGSFILSRNGSEANLPEWSLTETYESLAPRFWPNVQLQPFQQA